ncbi:MAG TPA: glycosyltransferase family 9 protein [Lapillicoccus sp.]|nr:glycosyltransferase family 9 protein [Lapillicoccus sp.]
MRAIRRALPEHRVALAAPPALAPLVRLAGVADRLVPTSGLEPLHWTEPPPAVAVNLHGRGPESSRLLCALRPWWLVAFAAEGVVSGPEWDPDEHEVDRWCRLVADAGWTVDRDNLRLERPPVPSPAPGAVVVHPGAAYPARRWPAERFAGLVTALVDAGADIVLTGSGDEAALAHRIRERSGRPDVPVLAGRTDLLQLAALVASARLVVSGDTGVAHLATAYGRPSVLLFGPTPPARWGPPATGPHTVIWHGDRPGDPFGSQPDPALLRITLDEVVSAAAHRLTA